MHVLSFLDADRLRYLSALSRAWASLVSQFVRARRGLLALRGATHVEHLGEECTAHMLSHMSGLDLACLSYASGCTLLANDRTGADPRLLRVPLPAQI
jgi:hypothetical protein